METWELCFRLLYTVKKTFKHSDEMIITYLARWSFRELCITDFLKGSNTKIKSWFMKYCKVFEIQLLITVIKQKIVSYLFFTFHPISVKNLYSFFKVQQYLCHDWLRKSIQIHTNVKCKSIKKSNKRVYFLISVQWSNIIK